MFYSEGNSERRLEEQIEIKVKRENGSVLTERDEVTNRPSEYMECLLNRPIPR